MCLQTRFIGVGDFRFLLSRDVFWMFVQQTIVFASGAFNRLASDVWTADPKRVIAAVKRGKQTLKSVH